jgi:hypothetical protein
MSAYILGGDAPGDCLAAMPLSARRLSAGQGRVWQGRAPVRDELRLVGIIARLFLAREPSSRYLIDRSKTPMLSSTTAWKGTQAGLARPVPVRRGQGSTLQLILQA